MTLNKISLSSLIVVVILSFVILHSPGFAKSPEILSEDFSNSKTALKKWRFKHPESWSINQEGELVLENKSGKPATGGTSPNFRQKGIKVSFRFNLVDARSMDMKINYANGGHICRFIFRKDGFYLRVNKNKPLKITKAFDMEKVKVRIEPKTWHTFAFEIKGSKITGTLNGQHSKTYQYEHVDNEIGNLGLSANGKTVLFDDFVVSPLTDEIAKQKASKPRTSPTKKAMAKSKPVAKPKSVEKPIPGIRHAWVKPFEQFLNNNCNDCHNSETREGNLNIASLVTNLSDEETMRRWVLIFDRVTKNEMPPKDFEQPAAKTKNEFLSNLGKTVYKSHANEREVVLRRLNRTEYENTVNDLFGTNIRVKELFPEDASKHGFDNNGEGLSLSAEQIEAYLDVASIVLDRVFGPNEKPKRISISKSLRELVPDNMYTRWHKLIENNEGTVVYSSNIGAGSQLTNYKTPTEGTYRFRFHAKAFQSDKPVMMQVQTGTITRSGVKRFMGFYSIPVTGRVVEFTDYMFPRESAYARPFGTIPNIASFTFRGKNKIENYRGAGLLFSKVEIEGPLEEWPPPSRKMLLGNINLKQGNLEDARILFTRFLPKAFRRPVRPEEIDNYLLKIKELVDSGRSFEESIRWGLRAALCSADFLFIEEPVEGKFINDHAIANRLSYFLWSSMPDAELMQLAEEGKLNNRSVLREQTERMLNDEKAKSLTTNFAHQWLDLREIDATSPDTKLYSDFDEYLKISMVKETEHFFDTILRDNESIKSFIDSDWLIINGRLAKHYGIDADLGENFEKVTLEPNSLRGGLMTQASILKVTANGANTSPVTRGLWMLENLMGIHPPPPPPNIPAVVPDVTGAKSLRQLLAVHRAEQSCNNCHKVIDPPGFALESFDAIGAFREKYRFQGSRRMLPVDSSGKTAKGETFKNIKDYKQLMLKEIDQVTKGLAEKILAYATGRAMGFSDRENVQKIVQRVKNKNYGFRELIHESIQSEIFLRP